MRRAARAAHRRAHARSAPSVLIVSRCMDSDSSCSSAREGKATRLKKMLEKKAPDGSQSIQVRRFAPRWNGYRLRVRIITLKRRDVSRGGFSPSSLRAEVSRRARKSSHK